MHPSTRGVSYPTLPEIEVAGAEGVALVVRGESTPAVGKFVASECKKGDQAVAPDSCLRDFVRP